jgi:hypothetical protein
MTLTATVCRNAASPADRAPSRAGSDASADPVPQRTRLTFTLMQESIAAESMSIRRVV